mmetsp:Transcript_31582/g.64458  ORF Transcript_31582/g.64458 Transcript_31582/m.64458 type:complete len:211 (-) Transcript_31582:587-1219(-)
MLPAAPNLHVLPATGARSQTTLRRQLGPRDGRRLRHRQGPGLQAGLPGPQRRPRLPRRRAPEKHPERNAVQIPLPPVPLRGRRLLAGQRLPRANRARHRRPLRPMHLQQRRLHRHGLRGPNTPRQNTRQHRMQRHRLLRHRPPLPGEARGVQIQRLRGLHVLRGGLHPHALRGELRGHQGLRVAAGVLFAHRGAGAGDRRVCRASESGGE